MQVHPGPEHGLHHDIIKHLFVKCMDTVDIVSTSRGHYLMGEIISNWTIYCLSVSRTKSEVKVWGSRTISMMMLHLS